MKFVCLSLLIILMSAQAFAQDEYRQECFNPGGAKFLIQENKSKDYGKKLKALDLVLTRIDRSEAVRTILLDSSVATNLLKWASSNNYFFIPTEEGDIVAPGVVQNSMLFHFNCMGRKCLRILNEGGTSYVDWVCNQIKIKN